MAQNPRQRRTVGRVMHEFKHGELKRSQGGKGGKVKSRRQAIAIALSESGSSNRQSARRNARNERRTERKEAQGRTAQQEREGKNHVGARGKRESTRAMGGKNARRTTSRARKAPSRGRRSDRYTRKELYERARRKGVEGRSRMNKQELKNALGLR
jgi:hypothetical protein